MVRGGVFYVLVGAWFGGFKSVPLFGLSWLRECGYRSFEILESLVYFIEDERDLEPGGTFSGFDYSGVDN